MEGRRKGDRHAASRHRYLAVLEGLTKRVQIPARELGHLVNEQHPPVGQRDFAGHGHTAAPSDQRGPGGGVMG
jgi:hypothetical protein